MLAQICSLCYIDGTDCKSAPAKEIGTSEANPRLRSKSSNLKICKFELFARFDYAQRPCIASSRISFDYAQPVRICNFTLQYSVPQIFKSSNLQIQNIYFTKGIHTVISVLPRLPQA